MRDGETDLPRFRVHISWLPPTDKNPVMLPLSSLKFFSNQRIHQTV